MKFLPHAPSSINIYKYKRFSHFNKCISEAFIFPRTKHNFLKLRFVRVLATRKGGGGGVGKVLPFIGYIGMCGA